MNYKIPKTIHQIMLGFTEADITSESLLANINALKQYSGWNYKVWHEEESEAFIEREFDDETINAYYSINPKYRAARADLLRMLIIQRNGGMYLDVKSALTKHPDDIIEDHEMVFHLITDWGYPETLGVMISIESRKFSPVYIDNYFIASIPENPIIDHVRRGLIRNIQNYHLQKNPPVGARGVYDTTGPWAYAPLLLEATQLYPNYTVKPTNVEVGTIPFKIKKYKLNKTTNNKSLVHYSKLKEPVILGNTLEGFYS